MASIKSQLVLNDGMTKPLRSITKALNLVISNFEAAQRASGKAIDTASITSARAELGRANRAVEEIEESLQNCGKSQEKFNNRISAGTSKAGGLLSKIKGIAATYLGMKGMGAMVGLSDELTSTKARLELIVDDGGSVEELQRKIYASAQSARASYTDTMATVAKLGLVAGKAFSSNNEIVYFSELVNKNFVVGGASATEQASAMYQLTQALGSGRLQGDEYRSIIENAPLLAKSIEDYMRNVQKATGTMKDWASEGMLTADVIKAAVFRSADEVEERFAKMPMTWGQVWTSMKNRAIKALDPVLQKINELANNPKVQNALNGLISGLEIVGAVALDVFENICNIYNFIADNWNLIGPIIEGIVTALLLYKAITFVIMVFEGIRAVAIGILAAAQMFQAGATFAATAAQHGLNAAIWACPITWIIALIVLFIAALVLLWEKCEGFREFWTSMWRKNMDVFLWAYNSVFVPVTNWYLDTQSKAASAVSNFCRFCVNTFYDMAISISNAITDVMKKMTGLINFYNKIANKMGVQTISIETMQQNTENLEKQRQKYLSAIDAYDDKYGKNPMQVKKIDEEKFNKNADELAGKIKDFTVTGWVKSKWDAIKSEMPQLDIPQLGDIAGDTSNIADSVQTTTEDLKYMRDLAEQEAINRFTTAEVKIDMTGMTNRIDSNMDLDGVLTTLTKGFSEALETAAEGVHA